MILPLATLAATVVAFLIGGVLVRTLGWPTSRRSLGRWLIALLTSAVVFSMMPGIVRRVAFVTGELPSVPLDELLPVLFVLAITALGYVAWHRDPASGEDAETRHDERRRADPAPLRLEEEPQGQVGGFRRIQPDDQDAA